MKGTRDYDGLRDFCHLPADTKLPYTLVFLVDGYWSLKSRLSTLRDQHHYLTDPILQKEDPDPDDVDGGYRDAFRLYRETNLSGHYTAKMKAEDRKELPHRLRYFRQTRDMEAGTYFYQPRLWKGLDEKAPDHDRVPFTWDFGFLLCNQRAWEQAAKITLREEVTDQLTNAVLTPRIKVSNVWNALNKVIAPLCAQDSEPNLDERLLRTPLRFYNAFGEKQWREHQDFFSWRWFFQACKKVAEVEEKRSGKPAIAFDLAMMAPDSLSCLFLEIWASEVRRTIAVLEAQKIAHLEGEVKWRKALLDRFSSRVYDNTDLRMDLSTWIEPHEGQFGDDFRVWARGMGINEAFVDGLKSLTAHSAFGYIGPTEHKEFAKLKELKVLVFPGFSLEMYKTWLLLIEVLNFDGYLNPERPFQLRYDRIADPSAVAARHWYKTACAASKESEAVHADERVVSTRIPVQLPGSFSVRGDWYLAVAKGSRSQRLADLALDMLSSRRANRTRLYQGVGLPTRDLAEGEQAGNMRTRLSISTPDFVSHVLYSDLTDLGGRYAEEIETDKTPDRLQWFFRSSFTDYDRHSSILGKWIGRVLTWTLQIRHELRKEWDAGFKAYDSLDKGDFTVVAVYKTPKPFATFIDLLAMDLKHGRLAYPDKQKPQP